MKSISPFLLAISSLLSCQQSQTGTDSTKKENSIHTVQPPTRELNATFENGTTQLHKTKRGDVADTILMTVHKPGLKLIKIITPTENANVRITQIISPSGEPDGPYGKTLSKMLGEKGIYTLIISENKMTGASYHGTYDLIISPY